MAVPVIFTLLFITHHIFQVKPLLSIKSFGEEFLHGACVASETNILQYNLKEALRLVLGTSATAFSSETTVCRWGLATSLGRRASRAVILSGKSSMQVDITTTKTQGTLLAQGLWATKGKQGRGIEAQNRNQRTPCLPTQ